MQIRTATDRTERRLKRQLVKRLPRIRLQFGNEDQAAASAARLRPASLASYSAASARAKSTSDDSWPSQTATPAEKVCADGVSGRSRSSNSTACAPSPYGMSRANSSPP